MGASPWHPAGSRQAGEPGDARPPRGPGRAGKENGDRGLKEGAGLPPGAGRGQGRFALAESRGASGRVVPVQRAAQCYGWLGLPCGAGYKAENAHCLWSLCQFMGQTSLSLEMNTLVLWNTRSSVPEGRQHTPLAWFVQIGCVSWPALCSGHFEIECLLTLNGFDFQGIPKTFKNCFLLLWHHVCN